MFDFGLLPPEVNSARIYAGPGSAPLIEASNAWTNLATELEQTAQDYQATVVGLLSAWRGPSSDQMLAATLPYIAWTRVTANHAAQTGQAAHAAASAYSAARNASVTPATVAANRTQLLTLVATNTFGQNAPAIAANEATYSEMWAQDVAAMNGYAAASQSATNAVVPFQAAPQVAQTPAEAVQAAAVPAQTTLLQFIQQLIPGFTVGDPLGNLADLLISPIGLSFLSSGAYIDPAIALLVGLLGFSMITAATQESAKAIANAGHAIGGNASANVTVPPSEPVKASTGNAGSLGRMRVPPSWAQPQQSSEGRSPVASPLSRDEHPQMPIGFPVILAVPVTGGRAKKRPGYSDPDDMHYGKKSPPILNRHPSGG
jgi:PPE-repeat protein